MGTSSTVPPPWELIWMCQKPGMLVPLEALTRLLAASCARQFGGLTAIVLADSAALRLVMWQNGNFTSPTVTTGLSAFSVLHFYRIFVVCPTDPNNLPASLASVAFDRIVYVTNRLPTSAPAALLARLKPQALNPSDPTEPYFSSFISSLLLTGPPPQKPRSGFPPFGPLLRAIARDALGLVPAPIVHLLGIPLPGDRFRSEPLDDDFARVEGGITARPRSRLARDACRLRFDVPEIARLWSKAQTDGTVWRFHRIVFNKRPAHRTTAGRWARAVTNRRLGLAVSGGGATSYRLVPLLQMLESRKVPIDVVGGLSGGASLAAYYCRDGKAGLDRYVSGPGSLLSIVGALLASVTSQPIESGLDWAFHDTTLDDLEVRLVAVTTALPEVGPPQAEAVIHGTLGEAVRVSGALPLFFARSVKHGVVYSDGATATQIPARALPNYGADYVFACNAIPGPDSRNPLRNWPGGEFVYRFTILGPLIDMFVSNGFLLERIGRDAGLYAHVFVEMTPNGASMTEIFRWDQAARLVAEAREDAHVQAGAAACAACWNDVKKDA